MPRPTCRGRRDTRALRDASEAACRRARRGGSAVSRTRDRRTAVEANSHLQREALVLDEDVMGIDTPFHEREIELCQVELHFQQRDVGPLGIEAHDVAVSEHPH